MARFLYRPQSILIISLFAILAFGCSSSAQLTPTHTEIPAVTITAVSLTITPSPIPPTETYTMVPPTNTVIPTLIETPTSTPSSTATDIPPSATLNEDAGCRMGPGTVYKILAFVSAGDVGIMDGRTQDNNWLRIQLPDAEEPCWVFSNFITQGGSTDQVAVMTPIPLPTATAAPTEKPGGIRYYLIAPDTGGPFACGDGLVYFYSGKRGNSAEEKTTIALNALFSVKTEYVNNYYNPIFKSNLIVKDVNIDANNHAIIRLGGNFVKPKSRCEAKRIRTQVWETARQFSNGKPDIYVNNVLLGDLLEAIQD